MIRINRVVTKSGDSGTTALSDGCRVSKACTRIEVCGTVDELNAHLGRAYTQARVAGALQLEQLIGSIQNDLFDAGAELATPAPTLAKRGSPLKEPHILRLEQCIEQLRQGLPELTSFVLPGGSMLNADLHLARTVCRRAERVIVRLSLEEEISPTIMVYFNRLSDLLFVMARLASAQQGIPEHLWKPGGGMPISDESQSAG